MSTVYAKSSNSAAPGGEPHTHILELLDVTYRYMKHGEVNNENDRMHNAS